MALQIVSFRGVIDKKTLSDYKGKLNYDLETVEERIGLTKDILKIEEINGVEFSKDDFWLEVSDMACCKSNINTSNALYSETDVAQYLEGLGSYILAKDRKPKEDKEKLKIYRDYDLFKRMLEETEKVGRLGKANSDMNNEVSVFVQQGNYRKAIEKKIFSEDIRNISGLKDYDNFRKYLIELRTSKEYRDKIKERVGGNTIKIGSKNTPLNIFIASTIKKNLGIVKNDMIDLKEMIVRPFSAKLETKGDYTPDWNELDMFDEKHVKELIRVKTGNDLQDDLTCIAIDLENLLKKVKLTDNQREILNLWRQNKTQIEIGEILEISNSTVSRTIGTIVKNIINEYERQYEDWYYLNIRKGEYKKCSKCGEIKLVSRFNKNGSRGYMSMCKECR